MDMDMDVTYFISIEDGPDYLDKLTFDSKS